MFQRGIIILLAIQNEIGSFYRGIIVLRIGGEEKIELDLSSLIDELSLKIMCFWVRTERGALIETAIIGSYMFNHKWVSLFSYAFLWLALLGIERITEIEFDCSAIIYLYSVKIAVCDSVERC